MGWKDIAIFYAIGWIVIGGWFAVASKVETEIAGHPIPWPRVIGFVVVGALWPIAVAQYLWQGTIGTRP